MELIDRQAVVDAIEHHEKAVLGEHNYDEGIAYGYATAHRHLVDIVKRLPSVQSEREKGKWIHGREVYREYMGATLIMVKYSHWECSVCGYRTENEPLWSFCPNCGAYMKEENDETD